jgi:hypothetical protein
MFWRKQKKIDELTLRVAQLEGILCPYGSHNWIEINWHLESFDGGHTTDVVHHYTCSRCKKYLETTRRF